MIRQKALLYISLLALLIIFGSVLSYARADVTNHDLNQSSTNIPIKFSDDSPNPLVPLISPQSVSQIGPQLDGGANADNGDEFGFAVAIDGDTMVIGARFDELPSANATSTDAGIAYVYKRTPVATTTAWVLDTVLSAGQDYTGLDEFGASVAINGDLIAVGSPKTTPDTILDERSGAVFVFERGSDGTWGLPTVLHADIGLGTEDNPRAQSNDEFGTSVAIDNEIIVVGADKDETNLTDPDSGAAYVFERNAADPSKWDITKVLSADLFQDDIGKIQAVGNEADEFGNSVAIDGNTILVGAPVDEEGFGIDTDSDIDNTGMVYVFEKVVTATSTTWQFQKWLTAEGEEDTDDRFGNSVAIDNDTIIIGASRDMGTGSLDSGTAYVFTLIGNSWNRQSILQASDAERNDRFGRQVAIDGDIAIIGAFRKNVDNLGVRTGAAYVFNRDTNGDWSELEKVTGGAGAQSEDRFGAAVDYDSGTAIIGAPARNDAHKTIQDLGPGKALAFQIDGNIVDLSIETTIVKQNGQISITDVDELVFSVTIENHSTTTATDVEVVDKLPTNRVTHINHSSSENYDPVSGLWQVGSLSGGEIRALLISVEIVPSTSTVPIENTATITDLDQLDSDFSNNTDTASIGFVDLSLTKVVDNPSPNVGDTVKFTLTITNHSTSTTATGITVTEDTPVGLSHSSTDAITHGNYIPMTPPNDSLWLISGGLAPTESAILEVSYTVDAIQSGDPLNKTNNAEITASLELDPDSTPSNGDPSEDDFARVSITIPQVDLSLTKVVDNPSPNVGDTVEFTLTVTNHSTSTAATDITVTESAPTGLTYSSDSTTQGSYQSSNGMWSLGGLAPGASANLEVSYDVDAGQGGNTLINAAEITASIEFDPDSTPNNGDSSEDDFASTSITVQQADLSLTKSVTDLNPVEGQVTKYQLVVTNAGPNNATNIVLTDLLPTEVTFLSSSGDGSYSDASGEWTVSTVSTSTPATLDIDVRVNAGLGGAVVTNTAEIESVDQDDPDSIPGNGNPAEDDQASADFTPQVVVVPTADLSLTKTVSDAAPNLGDRITYTITVNNAGPDNATGIQVRDTLPDPSKITFVSSSDPTNFNSNTGIWIVGNLSATNSAILTITADVISGVGTGVIFNTAQITAADQDDPDSNPNDSQLDQDDISIVSVTIKAVDLSIAKTASSSNVSEGDSITFTISVTNKSTTLATGVVVNDLLPAGLTYVGDDSSGDYDSVAGEWVVGNLEPSITKTLSIDALVDTGTAGTQITNIAEVSSIEADTDNTNNSSDVTITVKRNADLELQKDVDRDKVNDGDSVVFALTLINTSVGTTATNVEVTDVLPIGATYISDVPDQGTYNDATGLWSVGDLGPSATATLEITAIVDFGASGGTITNNANIQSLDQNDPNAANDSNDASVQQNSRPIATTIGDLNFPEDASSTVITLLDKFSDPDGDALDFSFISNSNAALVDAGISIDGNGLALSFASDQHGTASITVRATDGLGLFQEASFNIIVAPVNDPPIAQDDNVEAPRGGTITIDNLLDNDTDVDGDGITIIAVTDGASGTTNITGSGQAVTYNHNGSLLTSDTFTYTISDGSLTSTATVSVVIQEPVDLSLTNTVSNPSATLGQSIIFTVTVNNNSSSTVATGVQVTNNLPNGVTYISSSPDQGSYAPDTGIWDVGTVANASSTSLQIVAQVTSSTAGISIQNEAFISKVDQFDLDTTNDIDTATITISSSTSSPPQNNDGGRRRDRTPDANSNTGLTVTTPVDQTLTPTQQPNQTPPDEGDGPPIPPEDIEEAPVEEAAEIISRASDNRAAETLENVSNQKASDVLSSVNRIKAGAIMNRVSVQKLTQIITVMPKDKLVERLSEVSTEQLNALETELLLEVLPNSVPATQIIPEIPPTTDPSLDEPSSRQETVNRVVYLVEQTIRNAWAKMIGSPAPIDEVLAKFTKDLTQVSVIVEDILEKPPRAPKFPPDDVLNSMFTIDLPELNAEDISVAHVTVYVDKDWVRENDINKWSIKFNRLDEELNTWVPYPSQRVREDEERIFYSIGIPGFSLFAITGSKTLPEPVFEVTNLQVSPSVVEEGQPVTITALVRNMGDAQGVFPAGLYINNTIEDSEAFIVEANQERQISFTVSKESGSYRARIERLFAQFQVVAPVQPEPTVEPTPTPVPQTPTPSPTPEPTATPVPTPSPTATATPSPTPSPTPTVVALAVAVPVPTATAFPPLPAIAPPPELTAPPVASNDGDNRMIVVAVVLGLGILGAAGVVGFVGFDARRNEDSE